ncbi:MAG: hypothetical protein JWQ72_3345 [Polaromonas sp.]|nr:hypothetical protein [Polaromonas sp.]
MQLSDFLTSAIAQLYGTGSVALPAGVAVSQGDLVSAATDNRGYPCQTVDYAVVGNAAQVVAQTSLVGGVAMSGYDRITPVQGADGALYFTSPADTTPQGIKITKTSALGTNPISAIATATLGIYNPKIRLLSNGNVVVSGSMSTDVGFAVYDANLNVVLAWTLASVSSDMKANGEYDICASTSGGFAISYCDSSGNQRLTTYSNAGAVVSARATIQVWTGTAGAVYTSMYPLSNGAFVVAVGTKYATTQGVYHGVWTAAGAQVAAFANVSTATAFNGPPELNAFGGFYALAWSDGTNHFAKVFSNAGALQGGLYTSGAAASTGRNGRKVLNDGTNFLYVFKSDTTPSIAVAVLSTTGTGFVTNITTVAQVGGLDAFYERNRVVVIQQGASTQKLNYAVISTLNFVTLTAASDFGTAPTTGGSSVGILPGGDFTFVAAWGITGPASTVYYVGKYADTCILGVARAAAAAGALATVQPSAGAYPCNQMRGSIIKTFDHSAVNLPGNKGTLLPAGAVLKGM